MVSAEERLGRLLAIVPWVAARDGPELREVCRRFDVSETDLVTDLQLLFLCGVYPFTPDVLVDVDISDGRVWIRMADWFRRPLRLSPQEGLALISAGSALLRLPGADVNGPLARGLSKLENALGVGADDSFEVDLGSVGAQTLDVIRRGVDEHRKLSLDYYSFGRDGRARRVVRPWQLFSSSGNWYMRAWCETAGGERLFRVDRVAGVELLDAAFDASEAEHGARPGSNPTLFQPGPDDPIVVLDLDPPAHWIASQYPNEGVVERPRGVLRVRLRVASPAWLERVLLRAGRHARVVQGDGVTASEAATRVLARYRREGRLG